MSIKISAQIFTGGLTSGLSTGSAGGKTVPFGEIEKKLEAVLPVLPVNKLIMGWAADRETYEKTAIFLEKRGIEFYLWFPVFSETGAICDLDPLIDLDGNKIDSKGHGEENFAFCCPRSDKNMEKITGIYEKYFSGIPFTGIFLDKIRYPSFANDPAAVFSCFCPQCEEFYNARGINIKLLKKSSAGIIKYNGNGNYELKNEFVKEFFTAKQKIITESVGLLCGFLRSKNKKIALDVFAPFLAPFTGQDLTALSGLCDFIKPMMYRITRAPAGLPFEAKALLNETRSSSMTISEFPFDLGFAAKELKDLVSVSGCPVYAGLEINHKKNLAEATPAYIKETINAYSKTGIRGLALSWDIIDAPEENIAAAGEAVRAVNYR